MGLKHHTTHTYETDGETFPLPFDPEGDPEHVYIAENGLKAVLAFLVPDDSPEDPFDGDEGEFYQFNGRYIHSTNQPDIEEFKRIIRANPGRVFTHSGTTDNHGPGTCNCHTTSPPLTAEHTKGDKRTGENSAAERYLDDAAGYYIAPEDATDPAKYAAGALETYTSWCNGDVYGVVVWEYTRQSIADDWDDPDRDAECWGYYGRDGYTAEELKSQFIYAVTHGDPSRENNPEWRF